MLELCGFRAWLTDLDNKPFHDIEIDESLSYEELQPENKISATVDVPPGTKYVLHWERVDHPPMSAWCEIFTIFPNGRKVRSAARQMDKARPRTQKTSSDGRVDKGAYLQVPQVKPIDRLFRGSVSLEIRRAKGPIIVKCIDGIDDIEIDIIDAKEEGKSPYLAFEFKFIFSGTQEPPEDRRVARRRLSSTVPDSEEEDDQEVQPGGSGYCSPPPSAGRRQRRRITANARSSLDELDARIARQKAELADLDKRTKNLKKALEDKEHKRKIAASKDLERKIKAKSAELKRLKQQLGDK